MDKFKEDAHEANQVRILYPQPVVLQNSRTSRAHLSHHAMGILGTVASMVSVLVASWAAAGRPYPAVVVLLDGLQQMGLAGADIAGGDTHPPISPVECSPAQNHARSW